MNPSSTFTLTCDTSFTKDDVVFVSGHLDGNMVYFLEYYQPLLAQAVEAGCRFVIGDARGVDALAQWYLFGRGVKAVTIYHATTKAYNTPRHNIGKWPTNGNWATQTQKDAAMTYASNKDIAVVAEGREARGTAQNLLRRAELRAKQQELLTAQENAFKTAFLPAARQQVNGRLPGLIYQSLKRKQDKR